MTRYANYDHRVPAPSPVLGWYDTEFRYYPNLPDMADMLEMTDFQWEVRTEGSWAVSLGTLVAYTSPPPPVEPLVERIMAGIVLTSTGSPDLNATYALDEVSTAQIFQIGLYASQFGVFPSGGTMVPYPDITGVPHLFSIAQFVAFLREVAPMVSALTTQAGILKAGGTPTWPTQTATIL